jgi:hypothetical protein
VETLGYHPRRSESFFLAKRADGWELADHHFANVHCPLQEVFLLPLGFLQLHVGSDVDAVALVVPAGRLIDGLEAMNGTAELPPHCRFGALHRNLNK